MAMTVPRDQCLEVIEYIILNFLTFKTWNKFSSFNYNYEKIKILQQYKVIIFNNEHYFSFKKHDSNTLYLEASEEEWVNPKTTKARVVCYAIIQG